VLHDQGVALAFDSQTRRVGAFPTLSIFSTTDKYLGYANRRSALKPY